MAYVLDPYLDNLVYIIFIIWYFVASFCHYAKQNLLQEIIGKVARQLKRTKQKNVIARPPKTTQKLKIF